MYAYRRTYVKNWDHDEPKDHYKVQITRGGKPVPAFTTASHVDEEVMYWRKANQVHAWFVDNVQDGEDDCKLHYFSSDKLTELLELCNRVIGSATMVDGEITTATVYDKEHPEGRREAEPGKVLQDTTVAEELLPTREGFFFGCYDYDQYYLDDVVRTRDWAIQMLNDIEKGASSNFYYQSSW